VNTTEYKISISKNNIWFVYNRKYNKILEKIILKCFEIEKTALKIQTDNCFGKEIDWLKLNIQKIP